MFYDMQMYIKAFNATKHVSASHNETQDIIV